MSMPMTFDDLDTSEAWIVLRTSLSQLASFAAGSVKENFDDREIHFSGKYLERALKVSADSSTGAPELKVKVVNPRGELWVYYDPEDVPKAVDPDWDEGGDIKLFLGPGVSIEGSKEDLEEKKAMMGSLVPNLIVQFMHATNAKKLSITEDELEVGYYTDVLTRPLGDQIKLSLEYISQICRELGC